MTLKLTLGVTRGARSAERERVPEPEVAEEVPEQQPPPVTRRAPELDLALAMGTVAELSSSPLIDPDSPPSEDPSDGPPVEALNGSRSLDDASPLRQLAIRDGGLEQADGAGDLAIPDSSAVDGAVAMRPPVAERAQEAAAIDPVGTGEDGVGEDRDGEPGLDGAVVAVLGLEPGGLGAAIALRRAGAKVIGIERSASRLERIRSGAAGFACGSQQELRALLAGSGFVLTEDPETLAAAEYVVVCVTAGVDRERRPNLEPLERACAAVVQQARPGQTILLTSSSHVGSTRELLVDPLEERGMHVGEDVFVAYAGAHSDRDDTGVSLPRVVGAVSENCWERASTILRYLGGELQRVSSPETAEMAKLYADTARAVRVALAFEMADACRANALNPIEVADAIGGEPAAFATSWTSPDLDGCAVGVDAHHLAQPLRGGGRPATITEEALRKLAARPRQVVWRAQELLVRSGRELAGAAILVVGASGRPGVVDIRQAPAVEIIGRLLAEGADVDYHDPLVPDLQIGDEWISGVDPDPRRDASGFGPEEYALAIIVTIHPDHDYGWLRRVPEVLDCTYRTPGGRRRFVL